MSKSANAVGDFVAANKVPIATGATAMALAALLSKRNRLAKTLGWGAVGAGLGKAGQLYLDAYKRPEPSVPDYLKRQEAKPQEPVFNTDLPGVSPRVQAAIAGAKLPIASRVPDYLKRQPAPVQKPVLNTDLPGVSPRIQAAMTAAKLPTRAERQQADRDAVGAGLDAHKRREQQAARAVQMAKMQQRRPGMELLKDTAKETARNLIAPAASYVDKVTGRARDIAEALGKSAEGRKNIKRLEAERKAQLKRQQKELGHVPRTTSQKLDNLLYRLLSK